MKKDKKIRREVLDELLAGYTKPEDLCGEIVSSVRRAQERIPIRGSPPAAARLGALDDVP